MRLTKPFYMLSIFVPADIHSSWHTVKQPHIWFTSPSKFHVKYTRRRAYASTYLLILFVPVPVCARLLDLTCTLDFCQRHCSCIMCLMNGCCNYVALFFACCPADKRSTSMRRATATTAIWKDSIVTQCEGTSTNFFMLQLPHVYVHAA